MIWYWAHTINLIQTVACTENHGWKNCAIKDQYCMLANAILMYISHVLVLKHLKKRRRLSYYRHQCPTSRTVIIFAYLSILSWNNKIAMKTNIHRIIFLHDLFTMMQCIFRINLLGKNHIFTRYCIGSKKMLHLQAYLNIYHFSYERLIFCKKSLYLAN